MTHQLFARGLAGATYTPDEMKQMAQILGSLNLDDVASAAAGMDLVRRETYSRSRPVKQGSSRKSRSPTAGTWAQADEALDTYALTGASTTRSCPV